jgi:hypothetical protein
MQSGRETVSIFILGDDSDVFSVEICHNCFFYGLTKKLEHVDETVDAFDNVSIETWFNTRLDEKCQKI